MYIEVLIMELRLPGCESLKEKRRRLAGIKDRFGKLMNIAVCESDHQDNHKQSQWSFVAVAIDRKLIDSALTRIEQHLATEMDVVVIGTQRERL